LLTICALVPNLSFALELKDFEGTYKEVRTGYHFEARGNCGGYLAECPIAARVNYSPSDPFGNEVLFLDKRYAESASQESFVLGERNAWHYFDAVEVGKLEGLKLTVQLFKARRILKNKLVEIRSLELKPEHDGSTNLILNYTNGKGTCSLTCEFKKQ